MPKKINIQHSANLNWISNPTSDQISSKVNFNFRISKENLFIYRLRKLRVHQFTARF